MSNRRANRPGKPDPKQRLDVVQQWFQAVITHPDGVHQGMESSPAQQVIPLARQELETVIRRSQKLTAEKRLSIYANAYYARLVECLGECFPVLRRSVGEDVFQGFAVEYLQRHPPSSYTLDRLGEHFTRFLQETRPDREDLDRGTRATRWPDFLVDLATLEWAVGRVFDGPGTEFKPALDAGRLRDLDPERFARARLVPAACLRLLKFRYPVNTFFTAVRRASEGERVPIPEPALEFVALNRVDFVVRRHSLSQPEYILLEQLISGACVEEAIAAVAESTELDDETLAGELHRWFQYWTAERFFEGLAEPTATD